MIVNYELASSPKHLLGLPDDSSGKGKDYQAYDLRPEAHVVRGSNFGTLSSDLHVCTEACMLTYVYILNKY